MASVEALLEWGWWLEGRLRSLAEPRDDIKRDVGWRKRSVAMAQKEASCDAIKNVDVTVPGGEL